MEDQELVPISALQHYAYCPRQCALIHVEQTFDENLYTLRGRRAHERVDIPEHEMIAGVRVERALPLYSYELGLIGKADVVEFTEDGIPYPVEYKSGPRRQRNADEIQLCAQAICLEEMTGKPVLEGSIYYITTRRRRSVRFGGSLRAQVVIITRAVRSLLGSDRLPPPVTDKRCPKCSLIDACMPYALKGFARTAKKNALYALDEP